MLLRGLCARGALFALLVLTVFCFGYGKANASITAVTAFPPASGTEGDAATGWEVATFTIDGVVNSAADNYQAIVHFDDGQQITLPDADFSFIAGSGFVDTNNGDYVYGDDDPAELAHTALHVTSVTIKDLTVPNQATGGPSAGSYAISDASLNDDGPFPGTADIDPAPPTPATPYFINTVTITKLITFDDSDTTNTSASDFTTAPGYVKIAWPDGSTDTSVGAGATITVQETAIPGQYQISDTHTFTTYNGLTGPATIYGNPGYPVVGTVTVADAGGFVLGTVGNVAFNVLDATSVVVTPGATNTTPAAYGSTQTYSVAVTAAHGGNTILNEVGSGFPNNPADLHIYAGPYTPGGPNTDVTGDFTIGTPLSNNTGGTNETSVFPVTENSVPPGNFPLTFVYGPDPTHALSSATVASTATLTVGPDAAVVTLVTPPTSPTTTTNGAPGAEAFTAHVSFPTNNSGAGGTSSFSSSAGGVAPANATMSFYESMTAPVPGNFTGGVVPAGFTLVSTDPVNTSTGNATSSVVTFPTPGTYYITAVYNGDTNTPVETVPDAFNDWQVIVGPNTTTTVITSVTTPNTANPANPAVLTDPITFTATVTTATVGAATGTVTFYEVPASGPPVQIGTAQPLTPTGPNTYTASVTAPTGPTATDGLTAAGNYNIEAVYSGDTTAPPTFQGSTSPLYPESISPNTTTTTLAPSPAFPVGAGAPNTQTFTATVTSNFQEAGDGALGAEPQGTVSFFYGTAPGTLIQTVTLVQGGAFSDQSTASTTFTFPTAGTFPVYAVYNPVVVPNNITYTTSTSNTVSQVVTSPTTTTLTVAPNAAQFGQQQTFTAKVVGTGASAPTGTVFFTEGAAYPGGGLIGSATLVPGAGNTSIATLTAAAPFIGTFPFYASYQGDTANSPSSGSTTATVTQNSGTTVQLQSSHNPSQYSPLIIGPPATTFTAVVGPPVTVLGTTTYPSGTVNFYLNGTTLLGTATLNGIGIAQLPVEPAFLPIGNDAITAVYQGDTNFTGVTSPVLTQVVTGSSVPTTTTLTSSVNPTAPNGSTTLTADVAQNLPFGATTQIPSGTVSFYAVSEAAYGGTDPGESIVAQPANLIGTSTLGTGVDKNGNPNPPGQATFLWTPATAGYPYAVYAVYTPAVAPATPDTVDASSVSNEVTQTDVGTNVTGSLTATPSPARVGQPITLTETIFNTAPATPGATTPSGTVYFYNTTSGTILIGSATLVNNGDGTATATLSGIPALTFSTTGTQDFSAAYAGDATHTSIPEGTDNTTDVIGKVPTTTTVTATPANPTVGTVLNLSATVTAAAPSTATPTGSVVFTVDGNDLGLSPLSPTGTATNTYTVTSSTTFPITVSARYVPFSAPFYPSTSPTIVLGSTLVATTTTLTASPAAPGPVVVNTPVVLTATVVGAGGTPTGFVDFYAVNTSTGTTTTIASGVPVGPAGTATTIWIPTSAGVYQLYSIYDGDQTFASSNSADGTLTYIVTAGGTGTSTMTVSSSPNPSYPDQQVTLSATVSGAVMGIPPTGRVVFYIDGAFAGVSTFGHAGPTVTDATFKVTLPANDPQLTVGTHAITATYSGDTNFAPVTAAGPNQVVKIATAILTLSTEAEDAGDGSEFTDNPNVFSPNTEVEFIAQVTSGSPGETTSPTGTVTFTATSSTGTVIPLGTSLVGTSDDVTNGADVYYSFPAPGVYTITATYSGDQNYSPLTGATTTSTVTIANPLGTTTAVTVSPTTASVNGTVTVTATVTNSAAPSFGGPYGTVNFYLSAPGQSSGQPIPGNVGPIYVLVQNPITGNSTTLTLDPSQFASTNYQVLIGSADLTVGATSSTAAIGFSTSTAGAYTITAYFNQGPTTGFGDTTGPDEGVIGGDTGSGNSGQGTTSTTVDTDSGAPSSGGSYTAWLESFGAATAVFAGVVGNISPASAVEGSSVSMIITGSGFDASTKVYVNGVAVPTLFVSPTTVIATFTAGLPGTDQVVVVTPDTGVSSAPQTFTVTAAPLTLTGATGLTAKSGVATSLTFATYTDPATGLTYSATVSPDVTGVSTAGNAVTGTFQDSVTSTTTVPVTVTVTASDGSVQTVTVNVLVTAPVYTVPAGLQMISVPYDYSALPADTADNVLSLQPGEIATWTGNGYAIDGGLPGVTGNQTVPGRGYWVREPANAPINLVGAPVTGQFSYTLQPGWNQIGDPYTVSVPLSSVTFTATTTVDGVPAGSSISEGQAAAGGLIDSALFAYDSASNSYVGSASLEPFVGYWLHVKSSGPVTITYNN